MKKIKKNYVLIGAICLFFIGLHFYLYTHPIILKSTNLQIEANEKYNYKDNIFFIYFSNKDLVTINKKIDTTKIDEYDIEYQYKNKTKLCHIQIVDTTPPVLKLKDYKTDCVEKITSDKFIESCKDFSDVTFTIETKNYTKEGKTKIEIKATDSYNNQTTETCTLTRIKDETPPKLKGIQKSIEVYQGQSYDYQSVSITDDFDPNPSLSINNEVDFTIPGTYTIEYVAKDRSGNTTKKTSNIVVLENAEADMKVVYLTFDDGPSYNTEKVLDILKKHKVKATFFVTGNGQQYNNLITRAYNEGHTIGLHTYTHNYEYVYSSIDNYFEDLNKISDMVFQLAGEKSNVIRFPGGSSNTVSKNYKDGIMSELVQLVQDKGYQYYDWNVSSGDAAGFGIESEVIIEQSNVGKGDKVMILFHDAYGKDTTVEALEKVIEHYKKEGYVFKPIHKETSYICHHGVNN